MTATQPLTEEELAELPSAPIIYRTTALRLIADLRASHAKIKNLEDDVRYWQQEAESRG